MASLDIHVEGQSVASDIHGNTEEIAVLSVMAILGVYKSMANDNKPEADVFRHAFLKTINNDSFWDQILTNSKEVKTIERAGDQSDEGTAGGQESCQEA